MAKTSRLRDQLYMLQGSRCFYCDRAIAPNDRSLEHIIADSIGGFANDENAVVVCQDANHLLGDASPKRKMMMLKAGGGRIECPKQGNCAKPSAGQDSASCDHTIEPTQARITPVAAAQKQMQMQKNQSTGNSQVQPAAVKQNGQSHGRNTPTKTKPKKKPRPHLKSPRSVH